MITECDFCNKHVSECGRLSKYRYTKGITAHLCKSCKAAEKLHGDIT